MTTDDETATTTRRRVISAGAVGLGAAAIAGALPATSALAMPTGAGPSNAGAAAAADLRAAVGALGVGPIEPTIVPGAVAVALHYSMAQIVSVDGDPDPVGEIIYQGLAIKSGTYLEVPVPVPVGARIAQIDAYFLRANAGDPIPIQLLSTLFNGVEDNLIGQFATGGGNLTLDATFAPATPVTVTADGAYFLQMAPPNNVGFMGAVVQYLPATPQLHVLDTPVRVYDSRPGNPPETAVEGPLSGGVRADIDATAFGSGVPKGATAILATVTVVDTEGRGHLVAYRNGIPTPGISTINWYERHAIAANTTLIGLDANGHFAAAVGTGAAANFFVDVLGYYI